MRVLPNTEVVTGLDAPMHGYAFKLLPNVLHDGGPGKTNTYCNYFKNKIKYQLLKIRKLTSMMEK